MSMFSSACKESCGCGGNATTDTVKVDMADIAEQAEEEKRRREQEEEEERQEQLRQLKEQEEVRRQEEEKRQAALQERRRQEDEARREAEKREEDRRKADQLEARRQAMERERQIAAQKERKRREEVRAFLEKEKFAGVSEPRKGWFSTTFALHRAAELNNAAMCEMLVEEGADPEQQNSSKRTAYQVAFRANRKDSHAQVMKVLQGRASSEG
mmetsp:Transcript_11058/g.32666  ORF Transcript_11058/g.32666 Transcript_11058/m.32666 type:complete len:213 (-) Transcript_11058:89-727(-)